MRNRPLNHLYYGDNLDVLRDLKRINAHIAAVAYPILEQGGELEETRLRVLPG